MAHSKTSQLRYLLRKSARLSTFLSAQKSKFTLESPFLSGFTLLSAQKSAQATSQPLCLYLRAIHCAYEDFLLIFREMFVDLFILQKSFSGAAAMDQFVSNRVA